MGQPLQIIQLEVIFSTFLERFKTLVFICNKARSDE